MREGRLDLEPIKLNGDWTIEDPGQGRVESRREENEGKEWEAVSPGADCSEKVKAHDRGPPRVNALDWSIAKLTQPSKWPQEKVDRKQDPQAIQED